jgi:large subunit ribosomal protein L22
MGTVKNTDNVYALARHVRMSSSKVSRVLNQIRGRSCEEAEMILTYMPYRACGVVKQLVVSASANAEHNNNLDKKDLFIAEAFANPGVTMKRFQPRAQGRAFKIKKRTCHITIGVRSTVVDNK